jgi:hypothetical protein
MEPKKHNKQETYNMMRAIITAGTRKWGYSKPPTRLKCQQKIKTTEQNIEKLVNI